MGPGSLLLYFDAVLVTMGVLAWHHIRRRPLNRGEPGEKDSYVAMGTSSQAVLQLDPRAPAENNT